MDNTFERARAAYGSGAYDDATLEFLFPQLKESEDERIRKGLIEALKTSKTVGELKFILPEPTREECIAYLEKQKEQKPHLELKTGKWYICHRAFCARADHLTVKEGERFQCEKDGIVKGFVIKEPEKYFKECSAPEPMEKEQKPVEGDNETEIQKAFREGKSAGRKEVFDHPEEYGLQKPAEWDDKDEKVYDYLKTGFEYASDNPALLNSILSGASDATIQDYRNFIDKLKLLRPQPKQEWNEEDKNVIETLIRELRLNAQFKIAVRKLGLDYIQTLTVLDKCRRLCPQPKQEWSEEDEDMLNSCISSIEEAKENRYAYKETDGDTSYDHEIAWLKSLRPSWKPSEE